MKTNLIKVNSKKAEMSETTILIILVLALIFFGLAIIGWKLMKFKSTVGS